MSAHRRPVRSAAGALRQPGRLCSTTGLFLAGRVEYPEVRETRTRMPDTMRAPVKEVVEKALKLDEHGRAEVVEVLLKSLEVEDLEEEADFVAELDRRAAEMEAGKVRGIPWEELWAELQRERGGS
jgi:putative addiction module component (TIGR02574 family)